MVQNESAWKKEEFRAGRIFAALFVLIWSTGVIAIGLGDDIHSTDVVASFPRIGIMLLGPCFLFCMARSVYRGTETVIVDLDARRITIERKGLFSGNIVDRSEVPLSEVRRTEIQEVWSGGESGAGVAGYELVVRLRSGRRVSVFSSIGPFISRDEVEARRALLERSL